MSTIIPLTCDSNQWLCHYQGVGSFSCNCKKLIQCCFSQPTFLKKIYIFSSTAPILLVCRNLKLNIGCQNSSSIMGYRKKSSRIIFRNTVIYPLLSEVKGGGQESLQKVYKFWADSLKGCIIWWLCVCVRGGTRCCEDGAEMRKEFQEEMTA